MLGFFYLTSQPFTDPFLSMKTPLQLFSELSEKVDRNNEISSSVALFKKGKIEIFKKLIEEAAEVWMATQYEDAEQQSLEISQYTYYVLLMSLSLQLPKEKLSNLLAAFEFQNSFISVDEPNKQLIYLSIDWFNETNEKKQIDILKNILNSILNILHKTNLTKEDIYKKL